MDLYAQHLNSFSRWIVYGFYHLTPWFVSTDQYYKFDAFVNLKLNSEERIRPVAVNFHTVVKYCVHGIFYSYSDQNGAT